MTTTTRTFVFSVLTLALIASIVGWFVTASKTPSSTPQPNVVPGIAGTPATHASSATAATTASAESDRSHLADELNAPGGTIGNDVRVLEEIFAHWATNFPHAGNPVGTNAEITAALTGKNKLGLALIPPDHVAINRDGELVDRWGTPFRFHQWSGTVMEVISAGPDKKFATADDASSGAGPAQ